MKKVSAVQDVQVNGRSPLHHACEMCGNLAKVKYVVEKRRCDLFIQDIYGHTPVGLATTLNNT